MDNQKQSKPTSRKAHEAQILAEIKKIQGFDRLLADYPDLKRNKYLDFDKWVPYQVTMCERARLVGTPPKRILDIGCGTGLFLRCAKHFGHSGIGIDTPHEFYVRATQLLGVDRMTAPVQPFEPIAIDGPFDLVSAIAIVFDRHTQVEVEEYPRWSAPEWAYFLREVETKLSDHGTVFLNLNRGKKQKAAGINFYDEQVHGAMLPGYMENTNYFFDRPTLRRVIESLQNAAQPDRRTGTGN